MKQKDIALIIVVVIFSGVVSLILSNFLLNPSSAREATVEVIGPITSDFTNPDERFFNETSINPTQTIRISGSQNETPFKAEFAPGQNQ